MRSLAVVCFLLAFLLSGNPGEAGGIDADQRISQKTVHALMEKMKPQLPSGWSLAYDAEFHLISVTRDRPTAISHIAPSSGLDEKPEMGRFSFSLRVLPLLTKADYEQKKADNQALKKKISALYELLAKSPSVVGIRPGGPKGVRFHSAVSGEQATIDQYYRLQDELYDLPDGYFKDISLSWTSSLSFGTYGPSPDDPAVRLECESVRKKLEQVPSKY